MTTSAHGTAGPWGGGDWAPEPDSRDVRFDSPGEREVLAQKEPALWPDPDDAPDDWGPTEEAPQPASAGTWVRVHQSTAEGLSGRSLVFSSGLAAGACVGLDLVLTGGRMTFFFDLCFVVICLVGTMAVRRQDLFTAGVLPPLLFAAVIAVVAVVAPHAFESAPGVNKVFLSGLASHAAGLVGGYAAALLAVSARMAGSVHPR